MRDVQKIGKKKKKTETRRNDAAGPAAKTDDNLYLSRVKHTDEIGLPKSVFPTYCVSRKRREKRRSSCAYTAMSHSATFILCPVRRFIHARSLSSFPGPPPPVSLASSPRPSTSVYTYRLALQETDGLSRGGEGGDGDRGGDRRGWGGLVRDNRREERTRVMYVGVVNLLAVRLVSNSRFGASRPCSVFLVCVCARAYVYEHSIIIMYADARARVI